jgi:hypothetical protein
MKNKLTILLLLLFSIGTTLFAQPVSTTPTDGATGVSQATASVSWTAFDEGGFGNGNYDVQFNGTDGTYGTFVTQSLNQVGTSLALPALLYNTTYYWRVRDTDTDGFGFDGTWFQYSFTTILGPPTTIAATTLAATSFSANWTAHANGGAAGYKLDVATDVGFTTFVAGYSDLDVGLVTTYSVTGLANNTTYYYRVRAYDGNLPVNESANSNTTSALTLPGMPTLSTPANGATGQSLSVNLTWVAYGGAVDAYYLQVDDDPLFGSPLYDGNVGNITSFNPPGMANNTTYYWRLQAHNPSGWGTYSASFNFTTISAATAITSPVNNATGVSITTTFTWTAVAGANLYQLEVNDDNTFTNATEYTESINATTSSSATGLINNTTYYARVRTSNNGGTTWSSWSATVTFTTILATPSLTSPTNGYVGTTITPSLSWSLATSTTNVEYYIDYDTDGSAPWGNTVGPFGSSPQSLAGLGYNTTYYWRVRAVVTAGPPNAGETTSSSVFSFTTIPDGFTLLTPADNTKGVVATSNRSFTWSVATGANLYQIQIDDDPLFGSPLVQTTSGTTNYTVLSGTFSPGVVYYWRVRPSNNAGLTWGSWLSSFKFTTEYLLTPADLSVGISIIPTFDWLDVSGATGYTLEIATDNAFSSIVLTQATVASTYSLTLAQALTNGVTYYWRVTSNNAVPVVSGTWAFIVVQPSVPYLTNPLNGSTIVGNIVYFAWYVIGTSATNFVLEVDDASDFLTPIQTFSGLTSTYYNWTYSGLTPGSTYYWRVTAKTSGGVIVNYSSTWSFVAPGMPLVYPSYPIGGVTIYDTAPYLYYYTGTYYNGQYEVRYSTNSSVDGNGMLNVGATSLALTSNLYIQLPALTAGATYYWQVRSSNGVNTSAWSSVVSFVVYSSTVTTPIVPYLSYPTGGVTVYTNPPTLYWYIGTYTTGLEYYVEWDDNSSFNNGSGNRGNSGWISNLYYSLSSSLSSGTWYWHVKSRLAAPPNTESAYSSYDSFVIPASSSTVPTPTPIYPVGGVTVYVLNPTLSYYAYSASSLQYQINYSAWPSTDVNGVLDLANTTTAWTGSTTYALSGLTPGVTYYWQVRSRLTATPASMSTWSSVVSFTTAAGAFAVVPLIGSPDHGQAINNTTAVLSWIIPTQSSSQLSYKLEYASKPDMSDAKVITNINKPFQQIIGLNLSTTYYWRVTSSNQNGSSNPSAIGSFKINNITDVLKEEVIPTAFELSQNYPNPFNPTTKIAFALPQNSFVSLKIYDMLGREIKSLLNSEMLAGNHSIDWNGEDNNGFKVASGAYIYKITAGNFMAVKKMVLIK